jgi:3-oxoacyl-[acyl-carrier-protein] synthase-3
MSAPSSASRPFAAITSMGAYTPAQVLDNAELVRRFELGVDAAWIESRTGIQSRHWMQPGETTSDMVVAAARRIFERAEIEPREIDRLILATISPDHPSPSTATIVARKLGARCPAFDLSAACAGFLYALDLGSASVRGGEEKVLVLAADARSRYVDPTDPRSVVLFADGAAGVLLAPASRPGLRAIALGADGRASMGAWVPAGGAARPATAETVAAREHFLRVDGREEIFELFVRFTREAVFEVLEQAQLSIRDIDLFITHQGNAHMVEAVLQDLSFPASKAVNNVARHGNTSGATVPIALCEAWEEGRIRPGARVLLTAVGAGYTFGAAIHEF